MQQEISLDVAHKVESQIIGEIIENRAIYYFTKRVLDIFLASLALIVAFPFLIIVAILIKLDSKGPVFFVQDRVTVKRRILNHKSYWEKVTFRCYKLRTMVCNADPALHKSYIKALINNDCDEIVALQGEDSETRKLTHDPRVTRIGKILRKTSMDEVPQFLNVLKGEMSLVGPRPAIPYEVEMYKPWHYRRLEAKPGITGLVQVTARCSGDFDEIVSIDIQYVKKQSFLLDMKILLKTPIAVISGKGAA